jgi:hypothetical protein
VKPCGVFNMKLNVSYCVLQFVLYFFLSGCKYGSTLLNFQETLFWSLRIKCFLDGFAFYPDTNKFLDLSGFPNGFVRKCPMAYHTGVYGTSWIENASHCCYHWLRISYTIRNLENKLVRRLVFVFNVDL